jgi:hypothetical protein
MACINEWLVYFLEPYVYTCLCVHVTVVTPSIIIFIQIVTVHINFWKLSIGKKNLHNIATQYRGAKSDQSY